MVKKVYDWKNGAVLDQHSKKKHKILKEYFRKYLKTRCVLPHQEKFRLAIVDGFSGAGRYQCGSAGSPVLFIEVLRDTINEINIERSAQGFSSIKIECFFIFNDSEPGVIEQLRQNVTPLEAEIKENQKNLFVQIRYFDAEFGSAYADIKRIIADQKYGNVLFNLDQCGNSLIETEIIKDIVRSWPVCGSLFDIRN